MIIYTARHLTQHDSPLVSSIMASATTLEMTRSLEHHHQQIAILESKIKEWWKPFHKFMKLPPELRILVYNFYTIASIPPNQLCISCLPSEMPIANTSQLVKKEYLDAFYKTQSFPLRLSHEILEHRRRYVLAWMEDKSNIFAAMTDEDLLRIRHLQITPAFATSSSPDQYHSRRGSKPERLGFALDLVKGCVIVEADPQVLKSASKYVKQHDRPRGQSEYGHLRIGPETFSSISGKLQDVMNHIVHMGGKLQRYQLHMLVLALSDKPKTPYARVQSRMLNFHQN